MHFVSRVTSSPHIVEKPSVSPIARDKSGFADCVHSQHPPNEIVREEFATS